MVNYVIWCGLLLCGFTVWFSSLNSISGPNEHCSAVVGGMQVVSTLCSITFVVSGVGPLSSYQETMVKAFLPYLVDPHPLSVRKRAYIALCE